VLNPDRRQLVSANLGLVGFFARKFDREHFNDACQVGALTLVHASARFDPSRNVKFSTYVSKWLITSILRQRRRLEAWSEVSLDEPFHDGEHTGIDFLEDPGLLPDEVAGRSETRARVRTALDKLSARECAIIAHRYGFHGRDYTLQEVGDMFGLCRERVRQIEKDALGRLKVIMETSGDHRHPTRA